MVRLAKGEEHAPHYAGGLRGAVCCSAEPWENRQGRTEIVAHTYIIIYIYIYIIL